jgi:hypothetical protein
LHRNLYEFIKNWHWSILYPDWVLPLHSIIFSCKEFYNYIEWCTKNPIYAQTNYGLFVLRECLQLAAASSLARKSYGCQRHSSGVSFCWILIAFSNLL